MTPARSLWRMTFGPLGRLLVGLLMGPLLIRELRSAGRRRSTYIIRAAFSLLMTAAVAVAALSVVDSWSFGLSLIDQAQRLEFSAQTITLTALWVGFFTLALVGPMLTAGSICDERQARTLQTLATTPLRPLEIIAGKIAARMSEACILALIALPCLLALRVFGGVDGLTIVRFVLLSLATAYVGAALGIWFSTWHRGSAGAFIYASITLCLLLGAPPIVSGLMLTRFSPWMAAGPPSAFQEAVIAAGFVMSPPAMLIDGPGPSVATAAWLPWWLAQQPWLVTLVWLLLLGTAVAWFAAISLRRSMARELADAPKPVKKGRAVGSGGVPAGSGRLRLLGDRPVLWLNLTRRYFRRRWHAGVIAGVGIVGILYAYAEWGFDENTVHMLFGVAGLAVTGLSSAVACTSAVSGEREAQTWDVLLTTPLPGARILGGKLLAGWVRLLPVPALVVAHLLLASLLGSFPVSVVPMVMALLAGPILLYGATGLMLSLHFRRTITAAVLNALLILAHWVGLPVLFAVLGSVFFGFGSGRERWTEALILTNPFALLVAIIESTRDGWYNGEFDFPTGQVGYVSMLLRIGLHTGLHAVAAAGVLWLMLRRFRTRGGRSS